MSPALYIPPNDIITRALAEAGENSSQEISNPPYSFEVNIAKKHLDDAIQDALINFGGHFGSMRTRLVPFEHTTHPLSPGDKGWVFPDNVYFSPKNVQFIQGIYSSTEFGDRTRVDWQPRLVPSIDGSLPPVNVIITANTVPSELWCDFVYLYSYLDTDHVPSSGFDYKFSSYASILLARYIANGLNKTSRGNDLIVLATKHLAAMMAVLNRGRHQPIPRGGPIYNAKY